MGKFNVQAIRFLDAQHFRVLTSVEMGMKNHELVPLPLISSIAAIHRGASARTLNDLTRLSLVAYERGKKYDGYRLTTLGYDFLALRALCSRQIVGAVGNQIGVGKESDIYVGADPEMNDLVLKLHRLGRTSFRKLKEKRDYHRRRHFCSWLYLSRLAAAKEFAFLRALHAHKFPVPKPIDCSRHTVVMSLITGPTLCHVSALRDPAALYDKLMKLIVRLGTYGLIHGDFNEFNIMLVDDESPVLIDFPQMVSMDHPNAEFYFDRDVQCIRTFFERRFHFSADEWPRFGDVQRKRNLDVELEASGFTRQMRRDLNKAYDEGNFTAHLADFEEEEGSSGEDQQEGAEECWEDQEKDEEEMNAFQRDTEQMGAQLRGSDRFQQWLSEVKNELEALSVEEGNCTGEQLGKALLGTEREHKAMEVMGRMKKKDEEKEEENGEEEEREDANETLQMDGENENTDGGQDGRKGKKTKTSQRQKLQQQEGSVLSVGSTIIPQEEVRRRLMMEKRNVRKEKLRVKGQQNAVRRGRQQNQELIREYAGWDKY